MLLCDRGAEVMFCSAALLQLYMQANWTGPPLAGDRLVETVYPISCCSLSPAVVVEGEDTTDNTQQERIDEISLNILHQVGCHWFTPVCTSPSKPLSTPLLQSQLNCCVEINTGVALRRIRLTRAQYDPLSLFLSLSLFYTLSSTLSLQHSEQSHFNTHFNTHSSLFYLISIPTFSSP